MEFELSRFYCKYNVLYNVLTNIEALIRLQWTGWFGHLLLAYVTQGLFPHMYFMCFHRAVEHFVFFFRITDNNALVVLLPFILLFDLTIDITTVRIVIWYDYWYDLAFVPSILGIVWITATVCQLREALLYVP